MRRKRKPTVHERLRAAGVAGRPPTARELSASLRTLEDAGRDLASGPYRLWTYLINVQPDLLDAGVTVLGQRFGLEERTMFRLLRRLTDAGYVELEPGGRFEPTAIRLKIGMIAEPGNHVFKVGPAAFTIPKPLPQSLDPDTKLPKLTIIHGSNQPRQSSKTYTKLTDDDPKASTNLADPPANTTPTDHKSAPTDHQARTTTEHLPKDIPVRDKNGTRSLEPTAEPSTNLAKPSQSQDKDPARRTEMSGEPSSDKNDMPGHIEEHLSPSSFQDQGDRILDPCPRMSFLSDDKSSVPDPVAADPPAGDAKTPELSATAPPPAASATAPGGEPKADTHRDAPGAGEDSAARPGVDTAKLKRVRGARKPRVPTAALASGKQSKPIPEPGQTYGFTLTGKARDKLLGILNRGNTAKDRIRALKILGGLAQVAYDDWRAKRPGEAGYESHLDQRGRWQKFANAVFQRGIRPTLVFEFCADPANNFPRLNEPAHHIPFVCSPATVDAAYEASKSKGRVSHHAPPQRVDELHAYHPRKLHPELRQTLEDAGHDVSAKTDGSLMTVQNYAKALAAGRNPYIDDDLAELGRAAKHLFEKPDAD